MSGARSRWQKRHDSQGLSRKDRLVLPYVASTLVDRLDRDWIWRILSTDAYWARWRTRADIDSQIDGAWRSVGVYETATGAQVGYARAVSDGVGDAYLADVIVHPAHRGGGVGKLILTTMIDDGPGSDFRWTLFTRDAHGLYTQYGFATPDETAMVRPSQRTSSAPWKGREA